jgi:hypothetical protein
MHSPIAFSNCAALTSFLLVGWLGNSTGFDKLVPIDPLNEQSRAEADPKKGKAHPD